MLCFYLWLHGMLPGWGWVTERMDIKNLGEARILSSPILWEIKLSWSLLLLLKQDWVFVLIMHQQNNLSATGLQLRQK